ncbi:MAG: hypothetical protein MI725_05910, partial [Pirellulales bacterium]|nr:hypothetical protein [Pirellulales bacterium]
PGGPGVTELLVDRVEVHGVLSDPNHQSRTHATIAAPTSPGAPLSTRQQPVPRPRVPRIIRWQGEPFELLSRLGFQAVGMSRLPSEQDFSEARKHGLLLVCPPPPAQRITADRISDKYNEVLAWDLGDQLSENDLEQMVRWQQLIKRYDDQDERPTVLAPQLFTREASRIADVVLLDRLVLGTDLSLHDYTTWLTHRSRLARPGTPTWTRMHTQLEPRQAAQLAGLGAGPGFSSNASYLHLVSLTSAAVGVKSTGFYFESSSSLAENDAATFQRAQALELTNLRLGLMEPWLATGKLLTSARCTEQQITALVLQAERSHLLVPMWWSNTMHHVNAPPAAGPLSLIVPGVAESSEAYLLTMGGPQRLRHQRVTGGIRITLDHLPADGLVMLTDDPGAFSQVARYLRCHAPRATQLRRNLAAIHWQEAARAYPTVSSTSISPDQLQASLAAAKRTLADCDAAAAGRNYELAYLQADAMERTLAASDYSLWQETTSGQSVAEIPFASDVATLPALSRVNRWLASTPAGQNLLPQGGFESLSALLEAGWRHHQLPLAGIASAVRLSPEAPHRGEFCLELEALPLDPNSPPAVVPTAPVWITSKTVPVRAGEVIEITGQARVPKELLGSVDGLKILDSLGGPQLALRIKVSPSWQPFRMVRVATADGEVKVSIALTGIGKAQIDDLALRTLTGNGVGEPTRAASLPPGP